MALRTLRLLATGALPVVLAAAFPSVLAWMVTSSPAPSMPPSAHSRVQAPSAVAIHVPAPSPAPSRTPVLPHRPTVDRLPNGLTVVTVPYHAPGIAAYYTLVRTGMRDEADRGHSGFAHLFRRLMLRGTERMSADEYEHRIESLGADNSAYSLHDANVYAVSLPSRSLPALVSLEAERFQHLSYSEADFRAEAQTALDEYTTRSTTTGHALWVTLAETAYTRHPYRHTMIGSLRDLQAMHGYYQYSRAFYRRFFTPDNTTIFVAGDVQREHVLELVRSAYGEWTGHRDEPQIPQEPEQHAPRSRALAWPREVPAEMVVAYRSPAFSTANVDAAALEVVHALAFGETSELYQRLVVRERKLTWIEPWKEEFHRDASLFVVGAGLAEGTRVEDAQRAIGDEFARIARGEYSAERIAEVVSHLRNAIPMAIQTPADAADALAHFTAVAGDVGALEQYAQRLAEVTPADVARVARTYLTPARRTVISVAPAPTPGAVARRAHPDAPTAPRTGG